MGYYYQLIARDPLYAPFHKQDTYKGSIWMLYHYAEPSSPNLRDCYTNFLYFYSHLKSTFYSFKKGFLWSKDEKRNISCNNCKQYLERDSCVLVQRQDQFHQTDRNTTVQTGVSRIHEPTKSTNSHIYTEDLKSKSEVYYSLMHICHKNTHHQKSENKINIQLWLLLLLLNCQGIKTTSWVNAVTYNVHIWHISTSWHGVF